MYFEIRFSYFYVIVCMLCLSYISFASCAGSTPTLVNPANPMIPRTQDFKECSEPVSCGGLYYCGNSGTTCYLRSCRYCTFSRGIYFPDYTPVPSCVETYLRYSMTLYAAIVKQESPHRVMRSVADACGVSSQMVILSVATSTTRTVVDIINTMSPSLISTAKYYTAYHIELGFFYDAYPDQNADLAASIFKSQLHWDTATIVDVPASSFSVGRGRAAAIFLNTSDFQITPATFAIQRCSDGTAVAGEETCPAADPALVAGTASTKTTTSRLLTIILPIIAVLFIALIIAAVVVVRRRRANKNEQQTVQHTEAAVDVSMA